jgi:hypothetical protein
MLDLTGLHCKLHLLLRPLGKKYSVAIKQSIPQVWPLWKPQKPELKVNRQNKMVLSLYH